MLPNEIKEYVNKLVDIRINEHINELKLNIDLQNKDIQDIRNDINILREGDQL